MPETLQPTALELEELVTESDELEDYEPPEPPDVSQIVTEDDRPVDNLPSEKQQRLLTDTLYSSWPGPGDDRPFLVAANVGIYPGLRQKPLVPDVFLSLDVTVPDDWWDKHKRTYFYWEFGKPPEVVIEIVSNRKGQETGRKLRDYARLGVTYYVVYDPLRQIQDTVLRVFELSGGNYVIKADFQLPQVGLELTLWQGQFEGKLDTWLRWRNPDKTIIPTGRERAEQERERAEQEHSRAERLAEKLRSLGVDPNTV